MGRGGTGLTSIARSFLYPQANDNFNVTGDWNNFGTTGVYAFKGSTPNASTWTDAAHAPWTTNHTGVLLVLAYSDHYAVQIAFSCGNSDTPKYRRK